MRISFVVAVFLFSACNPFLLFKPPSLRSLKAHGKPDGNIEVAVDNYGLPFIKAKNIPELMYGLGFMHAKDRLFQIDFLRHIALGRISELFGERALNHDRKLRILTYRLDEQLLRLSKEENELLDSYIRGVNDGAKY
ncbi:MAG TPA: penicillin acylase family protein, partial [Myxococcota bacterium]|nr:penicillin acylase family protein [Myxococcota bacterium]